MVWDTQNELAMWAYYMELRERRKREKKNRDRV